MGEYKIIFGSNTFIGCPNILVVDNEPLVTCEIGKDGQILVNATVYDEKGKKVAKLVRNSFVFNDKNDYDKTTSPQSLRLIRKSDGKVMVEAKVTGKDTITLNGTFYCREQCIVATDEGMTINPRT